MARVLFALFHGGGNIALILPIVSRAVARGHSVRVVLGPGVWQSRTPVSEALRDRIRGCGATDVPFCENVCDVPAEFPRFWTPKALAAATSYVGPYRWVLPWARNVALECEQTHPDVVCADFLLPGALVAAEAAGLPSVSLVHGVYKHRQVRGLPPFGLGLLPARGPLGWARDALLGTLVRYVYQRDALPRLNAARKHLGLAPLSSVDKQFDRAARVLLLSHRAFDFQAEDIPPNVRYVGAPTQDVDAARWLSPWAATDRRPLVLVSLSTLHQGQEDVMRRILTAVADLPVRVLVTLGPALERSEFAAPANAIIERYVPHAAVLPHAAVMVTQCGIGTLSKALARGVPLVCIPILGDQHDNAARVVARRAGVRLNSRASPREIRCALERVLSDQTFRINAAHLATAMRSDVEPAEAAVREMEAVSCMAGAAGC